MASPATASSPQKRSVPEADDTAESDALAPDAGVNTNTEREVSESSAKKQRINFLLAEEEQGATEPQSEHLFS